MSIADRGVILCSHCGQEFFFTPDLSARPIHTTTVCLLCGERTSVGEEPDPEAPDSAISEIPEVILVDDCSRSLRLRYLLGVLLVVASVAAFVHYPRLDPHLRSRQRALAYVERLGGHVSSAPPYWTPKGKKLPKYLEEVSSINLQHPVSDLRPLIPLREVRVLYCQHAHFDDESLRELYEFPWLRDVYLLDSRMTDAGLVILIEQAPGGNFVIESPHITDLGLKALRRQRSFSLELRKARITDAGLEEIARIQNIGRLGLIDTQVTGSGLKHLAGMSMSELSLRGSPVTDVGLRNLPKMWLQKLDLSETQITDEGVKELTRLALETLAIERTAVTPDGLHVFRNQARGPRIYVSSPPFTEADVRRCQTAGLDVQIPYKAAE